MAPGSETVIPISEAEQGGATSADYSGVPDTLTFGATDTSKTFTFSAADDTADDDGESVKLGFGTLPGGVSAGTNAEATVSITDDDVPSVSVSFEQASYTVAEGSSVTVKVKLDEDPERTVVIPLTKTNQDGATGSDYSGVPANVTFDSGDTEKTFSFAADADDVDDDGESVLLGFGATLPTGVSTGTTSEATVNITDDDLPQVNVTFEQSSYSVEERASVTVKVKLDADPERTVTVPILKVNQDGASSEDYSGVPANVVFNSGDTSKQIILNATDDDGESVKLSFGPLPQGVNAGTNSNTVVSITYNDVPSVSVSFAEASYTAQEGGSVTVKVKLSADPERTVTIALTKTN